MKAVILAGGRGARLKPLTNRIPKPLAKIGGKPLLEQQILLLRGYGIRDIWILSGYLGEEIEKFCNGGKKWSIAIHNLIEKKTLGTAGALKQLEGKIKGDFLVLSGDVCLDIDLDRLIKSHKKNKNSHSTIVVHPNDHPYDSDLVEIDENNRVSNFKLRTGRTQPRDLIFKNLTNAGVFILNPGILKNIPKNQKCDLEKDIFPKIIKSGSKIYAYNTPEYLKDIGSFERLRKVRQDFDSGKIKRLNLKFKRKAIFIDRDGTVNDEDFRLFPFAYSAISKINSSDFLTIIITNQPAIAKGLMTISQLESIHKKMETELGRSGAKLDGIYFCPHHPEAGFRGEIKELKIDCNCRKPKIGLLKRAAREFNIDLKNSFFIGDSTVDAKTADNAGVKFIGVKTGYALGDGCYPISGSVIVKTNLLEAVSSIL